MATFFPGEQLTQYNVYAQTLTIANNNSNIFTAVAGSLTEIRLLRFDDPGATVQLNINGPLGGSFIIPAKAWDGTWVTYLLPGGSVLYYQQNAAGNVPIVFAYKAIKYV